MDSDKLNLIVEKLRDPGLQELLEKERYMVIPGLSQLEEASLNSYTRPT